MATKNEHSAVNKSATKKETAAKQAKKSLPIINKAVDKPKPTDKILSVEEQNLLQQHQALKLQIELVPQSCFWSNVRSNVTKSQWDKIRMASYQKTNNLCSICGGQGTKHPVECHEVWIYDDTTMTQRLGFFQAICPLCHEVKHIGLAGVLGNGERAFNRFKEINDLDKITAEKIHSAIWKQWRIRSSQKWKLDIEHLHEHGLDPNELKDKHDCPYQSVCESGASFASLRKRLAYASPEFVMTNSSKAQDPTA